MEYDSEQNFKYLISDQRVESSSFGLKCIYGDLHREYIYYKC